MITIELYDGSVLKFNFPKDREQKFIDMWVDHKNKAVKLNGEEIKLSDILDCYLGAKEKVSNTPHIDLDSIKNLFGDILK
jgi:hypothetical protein